MRTLDKVRIQLANEMADRATGIWQTFVKQGKYWDLSFKYNQRRLQQANAELLRMATEIEPSFLPQFIKDYSKLFVENTANLFARIGDKPSETDTKAYLSDEFAYVYSSQLQDIRADHAQPEVSVVYSFRDRGVERLVLSINSLKAHTKIPFEVIVVDYGSSLQYQQELNEEAKRNHFHVVRSETLGLPWSRGAALNVGIKAAKGKYVVTTDMDMLFDADVLSICLESDKAGQIIHCRPLWLSKSGKKEDAYLGDYNQLGGFQFVTKDILENVGGFNEKIKFWGLEDIDLDHRFSGHGYTSLWIDDKVSMYHMWHPTTISSADYIRPQSSWFDSTEALMESIVDPLHTQPKWGQPLTEDDRPVLSHLGNVAEANVYKLENTYEKDIGKLIKLGQEKKVILLDFGPRKRDEQALNFIKFLTDLSILLRTRGVEMKPITNVNLDYFYLSLDLLRQHGLIDYYLMPDYSQAYLMFK